MPQRKGLLTPQNTFLDTIATRFDGTHIIKEFENSKAGVQCYQNFSSSVCQFISRSHQRTLAKTDDGKAECSFSNISKPFHLQFVYLVLIDDDKTLSFSDYFKYIIQNRSVNSDTLHSKKPTILSRFQTDSIRLTEYITNLTIEFSQSNPNNCSIQHFFLIFPDINYIIRYASRRMMLQLDSRCNLSDVVSFTVHQTRAVNNTLARMVNEMKFLLEKQCFLNNSNITIANKHSVAKKDGPEGSNVSVLVPIVIVGFIVFSCILTMRFCSEGESTLMMRAKIMKYQPEKDKQLLALIYQQIQKEGKPQIENRSYTASSDDKKFSKKNKKTSDRGLFACQPCCSKDVFSGPLVSTIACGLAPLKKATV